MKWNELKRIAEKSGWYLARHGKKHNVYRHPQKDYPILIGRHGKEEIAKGTYEDLKKKIGL